MLALPAMPARVAALPRDDRGYPVPWFVCWMKEGKPCHPAEGGKPDFRVIHPGRLATAYLRHRCWICGGQLGVHKVYVIGPMCVVNRVTSEPASHRDCATFAAEACPFLTRPREKRNAKNLPENAQAAGIPLDRNPGAVCLYETNSAQPFRAGPGILFRLGPPTRIGWYAQGRTATRAEIEDSISSGYPLLLELARKDGVEAIHELETQRQAAMQLLPAA